MLTVRIHLDDADQASGALMVIPGTHGDGLLSDAEMEQLAETRGVEICAVRAGDAVLMRPLTAHRSEKCETPKHRRVVHIEYAAGPLPLPLEWSESLELSEAPPGARPSSSQG